MVAQDEMIKRTYPRRSFKRLVGVLYAGSYELHHASVIGEGGMQVHVSHELDQSRPVVLSLEVSHQFIIVKADIKNCKKESDGNFAYGFQFISPGFDYCRAIRSYVAKKTNQEAQEENEPQVT